MQAKLLDSFGTLKSAPRDLWTIYILKLLESYSYFSMSVILTMFLSQEFKFTDTEAGIAYGIMGSLTSIYGLLVGFLIDSMGVRRSLLVGIAIVTVSRTILTIATSRTILFWTIFLGLPLGGCMVIPVMTLAVRRHTTTANRGFAFGLFYSIMNVGALVSGFVVDGLAMWIESAAPLGLSAHRWVFGSGALCSFAMFALASTLRPEAAHRPDSPPPSPRESVATPETDTCAQPAVWARSVREIWALRSFWRFLALTLITVNLRSIFRHLDASLPKYMVREFGPEVAKGTIYSLNPLVVIFLVPLLSAFTQSRDTFDVIHAGAYVTAASVFVLAIWSSVWACVAFIMVLSLGEALWSPRLYDYTVSVAPEGKEGMFLALSSAPLFFATLPVGLLSGFLLERYCPEEGPRDCRRMWLVIGVLTLSSPVLITLTERWIREPRHFRRKTEELQPDRQDRLPRFVRKPFNGDAGDGGTAVLLRSGSPHRGSTSPYRRSPSPSPQSAAAAAAAAAVAALLSSSAAAAEQPDDDEALPLLTPSVGSDDFDASTPLSRAALNFPPDPSPPGALGAPFGRGGAGGAVVVKMR